MSQATEGAPVFIHSLIARKEGTLGPKVKEFALLLLL